MKKAKKEKIILVSNIGSASRRYSVFRVLDGEISELFKVEFDEKEYYPKVKLEDALLEFFDIVKKEYDFRVGDIDIIAERVVAVGEYFLKNRIINQDYIEKVEEATRFDSLHTESLISEMHKILLIKETCKKKGIKCNFKLVGISDSAFHNTIKKEVYTYPIKNFKKESEYRRYGYHGISMSEIARKTKDKYEKVIGVHLGGGGSVTAIKNGESLYNSFGMTPVSGLVNLTRVGTIDPFVTLKLLKRNTKSFSLLDGMNAELVRTEREMYEESGLFALTGEKDMRDILANLKVKDKTKKEKAEFALELYLNRINEYIGSAYAHLGGCDAIVLTGSILEKSELFRKMFFKKMNWLNLKNEDILVVDTEEEKEIVKLVIEEKFI